MIGAIYQMLGIQTQDIRKIWDLGPIFFLAGIAYLTGILSSTSLFSLRFGVQYLPLTYLIEAGLLPLQLWLVSYLGQKMPQGSLIKRFFLIILSGMVLCLLGTFGMVIFKLNWSGFYLVLFIVCNVLLHILLPLMWMLANRICLLQQAKRLFPILDCLFNLGSICVGLFTWIANVVFTGMATEVVLLLSPVVLFVSLFLWRRIISNHFLSRDLEVDNKCGASMGTIIKNVWVTPLFRITLLSFITLIGLYYVVDYQFYCFSVKSYPGSDDLTQFLGTFFALGSGAALLMGLVLNRIMNGIGIGKTVVLMGGSTVGALFVCGLMSQSRWALPAFMVADLLMDQLVFTIFPIINEVFYKLLPVEQRAGTSLLFAGSTSAIGKLLSSIITGLHSGGVVTITVFSMIGISMALWYLFLSLRQKRLYFSTLLESIQNHVVSVLELASFSPGKFLDKRDIIPLQEALQSADTNKQLIALEFGAKIKNEALMPLIKTFQANPDPHKRLLAYQAMPNNLKGLEEICIRALQDDDPEIRCEAIQRLQGVIGNGQRLGEILKKHLNDTSPQVIGEIMITLYHNDVLDSDLDLKQQIHGQIEAMLGGDTENRVQVCRMIEASKARQYAVKVMEMVGCESSPRVRIAAVKCLGGLGSLEAVPWLLTNYSKADGELKQNIESALLIMGEGAVDLLLKGIDSNDVDIWYLCVTILVALDQERSFEKMLSRNCDVKLESWRGINEVPEVLEKTGMTDLASLYRERSEEICATILEACWKTLAIYFDPIIAGQLRQTFKEINSVEKREQGIELLNELSHKYPLTAEMANVLDREPLSERDQQLSFGEIMIRAKMEFSDYWLDIFSDYAIAHYREKSA